MTGEAMEPPTEHVPLPGERPPEAGPRVRVDSPDVEEPVPLGTLARPVPQPAGPQDPMAAASLAAALAPAVPRRGPLPLKRLMPTELRRRHHLPEVGKRGEAPDPVTSTPRPPS
jgi:hypothetical protein